MKRCGVILMSVVAAACSSSSSGKSDADYQADVVRGMHDSLLTDLDDLVQASTDLESAAPTPSGRGWDAAQDAAAISAMKAAWIRARTAYEHIEGAIAPIFPDIDASIDARYDDFMASLGDHDAQPTDHDAQAAEIREPAQCTGQDQPRARRERVGRQGR